MTANRSRRPLCTTASASTAKNIHPDFELSYGNQHAGALARIERRETAQNALASMCSPPSREAKASTISNAVFSDRKWAEPSHSTKCAPPLVSGVHRHVRRVAPDGASTSGRIADGGIGIDPR